MSQTVVGVFERREQAQQAASQLQGSGFSADSVRVMAASADAGSSTSSAARDADSPEDPGMFAGVRHFFSGLFSDDDDDHPHAQQYAEAVRRGNTIVRVDVDDDSRLDTVRDALQDAGALDIEERAAEWKQSGWAPRGKAETSETFSESGAAFRGSLSAGTTVGTADESAVGTMASPLATGGGIGQRDTSQGVTGEQVLPVVREDLAVGKRTVEGGRVRVFTRMVERPVSESVELVDERVRVERRPVDRAATEADLSALTDRTIELQETSERAVVEKSARVVEEVVVGMETERRSETVHATLRDTEVEVERVGADSGVSASTMRPFSDFDSDYRSDFRTHEAPLGGDYDDYEPHYRYGHSMASDARYSGSDWDSVEPHARSDWETKNPGSTWERFKGSVRRGWERATS